MKKIIKFQVFILIIVAFPITMDAQVSEHQARTKTIAAGPEYKKSSFYQWLWGKNYRPEWTTPVQFPILMLDTAKGGLMADAEGGGHQTTSLHLINKQGEKYTIRSVDKSLVKLIPKDFKNTFIDDIASDEISMSNPYGALAVPLMETQAGIYHANPKYYYVPEQPALDSLNKKYGNKLFLLEEKPENDWRGTNNFGSFDKYTSSVKVMEKIQESSDYQVDQKAFVKNRLFDILIGDWDRHDKQWKWGMVDDGKNKIYKPIPSDRDQAFSTYDGVLQKLVIAASGMKYLKSFDYTIKEVRTFDYERRILDRWFTNKLTLEDWQSAANYLKSTLTDEVISASIHQMPPEIFAIRGNTIIEKLKQRRDHLAETAKEYYLFLSKEVEIVGTEANDYFQVTRNDNNTTTVNLYKINKQREKKDNPYYSRVFNNEETDEIRLFGLAGNDIYDVQGNGQGRRIRIIGGADKDSVMISNKGKRLQIYDDAVSVVTSGSRPKVHIITDSIEHRYDFDTYRPDKKGLAPVAFYNENDRYYVGITYSHIHHKWHRLPFAYDQQLAVHYSLSQGAFSATYTGLFPKVIGKADIGIEGGYDPVRWINFFGLGNETPYLNKTKNYFQLRTKVAEAAVSIGNLIRKNGLRLTGFAQSVIVINDTARFVSKSSAGSPSDLYATKYFAGAQLSYGFAAVNDRVVPTSGVAFTGFGRYSQALDAGMNSYEKFGGTLDFFLPLTRKISLAIRNGGGTVLGDPEFYQYMFVGSAEDLRGYIRERFWGRTAFYNSNELRFITNFRSHLMNGKIGLLAYEDEGRVWMKGEQSNTWHTSYGGGLILVPFNKIMADLTYGKGDDGYVLQFRLTRSL